MKKIFPLLALCGAIAAAGDLKWVMGRGLCEWIDWKT